MQTVSFEKPIIESRLGLITFIFLCGCNGLIAQDSIKPPSVIWAKHTVMEQGHCNTAIAIDVNQDKAMDVIASFNGRVSLFIAPNWKEVVLHRFAGRSRGCIHSTGLTRMPTETWIGQERSRASIHFGWKILARPNPPKVLGRLE